MYVHMYVAGRTCKHLRVRKDLLLAEALHELESLGCSSALEKSKLFELLSPSTGSDRTLMYDDGPPLPSQALEIEPTAFICSCMLKKLASI